MTSQQVANKSERSLGEILLVVVLIALLMASFIFYFFKHQAQLTRVGFKSVSQVFLARVNGIRAQWHMDAQPHTIVINSNTADSSEKQIRVPINSTGWVDVKNSVMPCQHVWQYIMESPLIYMEQPIAAVLVETHGKQAMTYCQFSLPSGEYFTFRSSNGKVNFNQ
jgi:hypothetical protein